MPVYYCEKCDAGHQKPIVAAEKPEKCVECGSTEIVQDEDVLDTWFSSALWPFATLGWPEKTEDLAYFYPTSFLCTAPEILYLWVARMIFSGLEFMGEIPFSEVYLHSTILAKDGGRMSKSRPETIVDPMEMIETYGADATRFGIIYQTSRDLQAIKFSKEALLAGQKFANKLWNIARFIRMLEEGDNAMGGAAEGGERDGRGVTAGAEDKIRSEAQEVDKAPELKTDADKQITERFNQTLKAVEGFLAEYEFGKAAHGLYDFAWHDLADVYVEITKKEKNLTLLREIYCRLLILLHPFMPFITEEIYPAFRRAEDKELLAAGAWPREFGL